MKIDLVKTITVLVVTSILLSGCPQNDNNVSDTKTVSEWGSSVQLAPQEPLDHDRFGQSVSISGDYVIVGAYARPMGGVDRGAAFIYRRTGGNTWDTGTMLSASDAADNDRFGYSVGISGDYAIVGAYYKSNTGTIQGAAYIFRRTGLNIWDSGVKILASDIADNDQYGISVSISGDYAVVGCPRKDGAAANEGAAYIFRRTGTNSWDAGTKITSPNPESNDWFGTSVSISGDYIAVGAYGEDGTTTTDSGAAYIYQRTGQNAWDEVIKIFRLESLSDDNFGYSVSISGDYALAGACHDSTSEYNAGAVYLFKRAYLNTWVSGSKIISDNPDSGDEFGCSVSLFGDYAAVGSHKQAPGGGCYILKRINDYSMERYVKITTPSLADQDFFGCSVALSDEYLIVGASGKDEGGEKRGAVYVYKK